MKKFLLLFVCLFGKEAKPLRVFCWITMFLCLMGFVPKAYSQDEGLKKYSGQWFYDQCKKDLKKNNFQATSCEQYLAGFLQGQASSGFLFLQGLSSKEIETVKKRFADRNLDMCVPKGGDLLTEREFARKIIEKIAHDIENAELDLNVYQIAGILVQDTILKVFPCNDKTEEK